jgi:membrane protein implicated in regulation of membrane protease activity
MLTAFGFISLRWLWLALVIVFALIEIFTLGLTTVWFALAALVMVFLSPLPIPLIFQILIFLGLSALFLIFTRPVAVKKFKMGKEKTNVDSLIGRHALVVKTIGEFEKGEVKINGQIWSAFSEDNSEIGEGTKCEIVRIEGVRAVVRPLPPASGDGSETSPAAEQKNL